MRRSEIPPICLDVNFGSMSIVGVEKGSNNQRSTGVLAPVLLRYGAMENSVTELFEVSYAIAGTFQNLDFVIAAFREAVRPGAV